MKAFLAIILAMHVTVAAWAADEAVPSAALGAQDQQIDRLLTDSGMKKSLQRLPMELAAGLMQAAMRSGAGEEEQGELIKALQSALPKDAFVEHVSAALKKNYDERRYAHFLQLLSAPVAKKITGLEAQEPRPEDLRSFMAQTAKRPLPPGRIKLIRRVDAASGASSMATMLMIGSMEAGAMAAGGDCADARAKLRKAIARNRPQIEKANRDGVQVMLAFTYRDVSDADLAAYADIYEDKDAKWAMGIAVAAIEEQFTASMQQGAQGLKKIIQAHQKKKTMFAPKCGQSASPERGERADREERVKDEAAGDEPAQDAASRHEPISEQRAASAPAKHAAAPAPKAAEPESKAAAPANKVAAADTRTPVPQQKPAAAHTPARRGHRYAGAGTDLRDCLSLPTSAEIIACSER